MGFVTRSLWFVLVGWWFGIMWFAMSVALILSIVFAPIGLYTITKTWKVTTLKTSPKTVVKEVPRDEA